jgi:hypothetical protein
MVVVLAGIDAVNCFHDCVDLRMNMLEIPPGICGHK